MKLPVLSAAAVLLAASPASAKLTPHNTTYDYFTTFARQYVTSLSATVVRQDDMHLLPPFEAFVRATDDGLAAETMNAERFVDAVNAFFDTATGVRSSYKNLQQQFHEEQTPVLTMGAAPREWSDVTFDVAEGVAAKTKNQTLVTWVASQRVAMEELVLNGSSVALLETRRYAFLYAPEWSADADGLLDEAFEAMETQMKKEVNFDAFLDVVAGDEEEDADESA